MAESRGDDRTSGPKLGVPNGKAFEYFVFTVPLLLIIPWLPIRILGCVGLAYVLARCWNAARRDPALLAFLGFALAVVFASDLGGTELRTATVPYTGWSAEGPYGYSIFFAVVGLALGTRWGRFSVVWMCLLQVAIGSYAWASDGARWSLNPYLRVSVWQPAWTVFTPLAWAVVILLFRPRQRKAVNLARG